MQDYKCAFSSTMMQEAFACSMAKRVARRGGPDISCQSEAGHALCAQLLQNFKKAALPLFEVEDDLLSMPHSVLVKIQFGGLLGLQRILSPNGEQVVSDIFALVDKAQSHFAGVEQIPYSDFTTDMTSFKLRRRRG